MKIPLLSSKDFTNITDLSKQEIMSLFKFTAVLKKELKNGKQHNFLQRKSLGMIFEKSSTRTRVSFEVGVTQLGGHALFLSSSELQLGRGETIYDTAKVLSRYVDGIMIRTYSHDNVVHLAENADIPVINGLSDKYHPCQIMADLFTIYEREKRFPKVKLAYIGDGNNVANTLLLGAALLGIDIAVATPKECAPDKFAVEQAFQLSSKSGSKVMVTPNIQAALENANYLYTDVWVSMGQEKETLKKKKILKEYKISKKTLAMCAPKCKVLHCLPAHRNEELDSDVMDSDASIVFDQAENRLHVQKAIMCALMAK